MIRSDSGLRSTSAREVTISATYSPPPFSRHSRRNAALVIPAIGASTTGVSTTIRPMRSGGRTRVSEVVTRVILPPGDTCPARWRPERRSGPDEPRREVRRDLVERDAVLGLSLIHISEPTRLG